jgi:MATE family multidrug resistance protein
MADEALLPKIEFKKHFNYSRKDLKRISVKLGSRTLPQIMMPTGEAPNESLSIKDEINILFEILLSSGSFILPSILLFLIETINLISLGHYDPTFLQINVCSISMILIHCFGGDFSVGGMHALDSLGRQAYGKKDFDALYKLFNEARIFSLLLFLIFIFPICFNADYILYFLNFDDQFSALTGQFIKLALAAYFISLFSQVNIKMLFILGKNTIVTIINLLSLILHVIGCFTFVFAFNFGIYGVGISLIISNLTSLILTSYSIHTNNPFPYKDAIFIDMSTLSSSKFYLYSITGLQFGLLHFFRHLTFCAIVFACYYLDEGSLTVNTILLNYITLLYYILLGVCNFITQKLFEIIVNMSFERERKIFRGTIYVSFFLCLVVCIMNFLLKYFFYFLYVDGNENVASDFYFIANLYCFFIFFDWGSNICIAILKAMNRSQYMALVSSLLLLFIFLPSGLLLGFYAGFGIRGLWYPFFASMFIFSFIYLYFLYNLDFQKEFVKIHKELNTKKEEEEEEPVI